MTDELMQGSSGTGIRKRFSRIGTAGRSALLITLLGVVYHGVLLIAPPQSGNGLSSLPLVLFVLLALSPTLLAWIGFGAGSLYQSLRRDRRYLGICAGIWAITHAITKTNFSLGAQPASLLEQLLRPELVPALVALSLLIAMLGTSNDWSRVRLGRYWKSLHSLVWLVPGLALVHGWTASALYTQERVMHAPVLAPLMIIVVGVVIAAARRMVLRPLSFLIAGLMVGVLALLVMAPGPEVKVLMD